MGLSVNSCIATGRLKFKEDYCSFRSSVLAEGTSVSILLFALGLLLYGPINKINKLPITIYVLLLAEAFASFVCSYVTTCWIQEKEARTHFYVGLGRLILTTALSIVLLLNWNDKWGELYYGRVFGMAVPQIMVAVVLWVYIFKAKPVFYKKECWTYGIAFGLPMIFHTLSQQILTQSDKIMMDKEGTLGTEIGIYSFFYCFTSILLILRAALNNAWEPFYYEELDQKDYKKLNKKIYNFCQIFAALCCGFLILSREVVKLIVNDEFWIGMPILPVFVVMFYTIFIYQFYAFFEVYNAQPKIIAFGTCITALVNIMLNALLIPRYGMYGAAFASLSSYTILAIAHFTIVHLWKLQKYPLTSKPLFGGLVIVLLFCGLYFALKDLWIIRWLLGASIAIYLLFSIYKRKTIF